MVIDTHLSPFNTRFRSAAHYESLPREATIFEEKYQELLQLIRGVLHEGADGFHTKKIAFQTQLKKIRDNANVAIRNAMQIERGETLFTCQKLRDDTDHTLKQLHESHQQETGRLKELVQTLELTIGHLEQRVHLLQEKDQHRLTLQHEAVQEALRTKHHEHLEEIQRIQTAARDDLQRTKDEYERRLDKAQEALLHQDRAHQQQLDAARLQHQQAQQLLEQELQRTKDAQAALQTQMTLLKEKTQHTLQEERTLHEKSLSEQLAESLRVQAALKTEMATMIQQLHAAEHKRRQESELAFQRLRDQLTTQHALDIDQRHEKQQRELKRVRAELDVQLEDQLHKVKHMHEQELQRQIRITDRLQRVLARHGLGAQAMSDEESFRRQLTPTRTRTRTRPPSAATTATMREAAATTTTRESAASDSDTDAYGAPPPPPPPLPLPFAQTAAPAGGGGLQWGALSRSLQQQQQTQQSQGPQPSQGPRFSPSHLPPSTFALDEALAATSDRDGGSGAAAPAAAAAAAGATGASVAGNVRRMSSYLQALEDYLQGDETAAKDVDVSVATSVALSDILNVPLPLKNDDDRGGGNGSGGDGATARQANAAAAARATNERPATTTATKAAAAAPRPSPSGSLSSSSFTRFIEQFDGGFGDGASSVHTPQDGDLYVPSDSEDSLHRPTTSVGGGSSSTRRSPYAPLLTTVLSDA
eukprot:gene11835-8432_t